MSRPRTRDRAVDRGRGPSSKGVPREKQPLLRGKGRDAALSALLAGLTIALYSPVLWHSFVAFDDRDYVTTNSQVHEGLAWSTIRWAFTTFAAANWHPLTWLSHAFDYQLFTLNPAGHHFDSVLIHALNAVILFLLLTWTTKRTGPSLFVAAVFAVHPLNVESVAWVAERKNVLSTLFFLLAIAAYVRYTRKPDWQRYLLVAALFAAGLMAKPMVITLPFVLLLLDYWPLQRIQLDRPASNGVPRTGFTGPLLEKIPLLLLSAGSAWITVRAQRAGNAIGSMQEFPLALRIENAIVSYGLYLWKMLCPVRLAVLYPHPTVDLPAWRWVLSSGVLIAVTALVLIFRSKRYLPVGWFWFLGTLVPVIGLVQVGFAAMADRYAYIPLIGVFVMIAWGLDDWAKAKEIRTLWLTIPAACLVAALCLATSLQLSYWKNTYTLWEHALAVTERNSFAHEALATALMNPDPLMTQNNAANLDSEPKRMDEAQHHFEEALKIQRQEAEQNPNAYMYQVAVTLNELGILDEKRNRMDGARRYYLEGLQYYRQLAQQTPDVFLPDVAMTLNNLGNVDRLQNRPDEAHRHLEGALEVYRQLAQQNPNAYLPDRAAMLDKLAIVERLQNQNNEARADYEEAVRIRRQLAEQNPAVYLPGLAKTLSSFGLLDAAQNRLDEARQHYEEAWRIDQQLGQQDKAAYLPDTALVLSNLGNLDRQQNRLDDARLHFQASLRMYRDLAQQNPGAALPEMVMTLRNLGDLYLHQNQVDEARQCYDEALRVYRELAQHDPGKYLPSVAETLSYVGFLNRIQNRTEESRADYEEALTLFRRLLVGDGKYAGDVAKVEASLRELDKLNSR